VKNLRLRTAKFRLSAALPSFDFGLTFPSRKNSGSGSGVCSSLSDEAVPAIRQLPTDELKDSPVDDVAPAIRQSPTNQLLASPRAANLVYLFRFVWKNVAT
jgi:hypothetical protein